MEEEIRPEEQRKSRSLVPALLLQGKRNVLCQTLLISQMGQDCNPAPGLSVWGALVPLTSSGPAKLAVGGLREKLETATQGQLFQVGEQ